MSSGRTPHPRFRSLTGSYERFRQLVQEGAKFGVVGGIGVVIVLAGSDLLRYGAGLGKFAAVTVATVLATVFTFLGNRHWSFRHREGAGARSEGVVFFVLNGVGLLIQYGCIAFINVAMGLSSRLWYQIALILGIGLGTLFRFWSYRKWVWVPPEVRLAQLRRGRHRRGRDMSAIPPAASEPVLAGARRPPADPSRRRR